jgi:putative phage-type endonuclease
MAQQPSIAGDREQWLAERLTGIGASESPSVLGINPYKSAFQLWAEKCGLAEPEDLSSNEAVEFGVRLEKPVAEAFADRTGRHVEMWPAYTVVRDPERSWMLCTPDARQETTDRGEGLLQVKTTSAFNAADWADEPPLYYQVQVQHELAVTGFDWGTIVVLIGGQRLRYFDVERNDKFIAALLPRLESFWAAVQSKTPPEVDGSLATAKVLAKLHPEDNGQTVTLPPESAEWTIQLEQAKATIKGAEAVKIECENRIKAALGDATFGLLPDGSRWSWKTQDRAGYTVEPTTFRVLRKVK